jgi:GT2 family glycosyltransferase
MKPSIGDAPLVSIIVPCYNVERFVGEALDSALAQTHTHVEVIAVDAGSTDGTRAVLRRYAGQVRSISVDNGGGPGGTRNAGLALARGEFVQFLDADDLLEPEKVETALRLFDDSVDVVFCRNEYFREEAPPVRARLRELMIRRAGFGSGMGWDPARTAEYILRREVQTSMPLHRTASLRAAGGFKEKLWSLEDTELHFRLAARGARFRRQDRVLVRCRHHGSPFRLRQGPGRFVESLRALEIIRVVASEANALDRGVAAALADKYANVARKLLWDGREEEASQAHAQALALAPRPAPTSVPLYNLASQTVGFWRLERLCMAVARSFRRGAAAAGHQASAATSFREETR